MTRELEDAFERLSELSDDEQNQAAIILSQYLSSDERLGNGHSSEF